jgi:hypothetical protein
MVEICVLSIFDRLIRKMNGIEFHKFSQIIKKSILGEAILNVFKKPIADLLNGKGSVFEGDETDEELRKHHRTRTTLLQFID